MTDFGKMLRGFRLQAIDPQTKRLLSAGKIADMLHEREGYTVSPQNIYNWEQGKYRPDIGNRNLLIGLLQILYECGGLKTVAEVNELLTIGLHMRLTPEEERKIFGELSNYANGLPPKTYNEFIGRQQEKETIYKLVEAESIVGVTGLGGIGKTSLVRAIVELFQQEGGFDHIIWVTAKTDTFDTGVIRQDNNNPFHFNSFEDVLNQVGQQCGRIDIPRLSPSDKQIAIAHLLNQKRVLIVLDNLDTVKDADDVVYRIHQILGQSRLLLTSRYDIRYGSVHSHKLNGLLEEDGLALLRLEWQRLQPLNSLSGKDLRRIWLITGGAPLAMKLVMPQIARTHIDHVLNMLQRASLNEDDYTFYKFLYWHAWELLEENSRFTLIDFSNFAPVIGGTAEELEELTDLPKPQLWRAVAQLVTFSLVDKTFQQESPHYSLHHLTHYFVKSDITGSWA